MSCFLNISRWLLLVVLLSLLPITAAKAQPTAKIDSLKQALTIATDTARVKVLHELVKMTFSNDYLQAMAFARQGLLESKKIGWTWGEANGLEVVGRLYLRQENFSQAQKYLLQALALWRKQNQKQRVIAVTYYISEILDATKQYDKSLEWKNKALNLARLQHDTVALVDGYTGIGIIYSQKRQFMSALPYYQRALKLGQQQRLGKNIIDGENIYLPLIYNNIADVYIEVNRPKEAVPYLFKAIRMSRKEKNEAATAIFETTLAQAYTKLSRREMAVYHAQIAHRLSTKNQSIAILITVNDLLDTLYAQQGNYRLARQHSAENRRLEAQIRQQEQEGKVAEMQGRYDTREKERNIKLLTQQNQIARLSALQQRTLRNAAFVTAGLLLLAVGILFNRYQLRQRTVRQLNDQKQALEIRDQEKELLLREKTLLLQEVHHRVKNNLQIVLSLLNTQVNTLHEPAAIEAIRDSQSRVQTMALIHQNLYQSESLARIDMERYVAELTEAIVRAYRTEAAAVQLTREVAPLQLNTHTAVPLGLIVNELVTNALKYAFPPDQPDKRVRVRLEQLPEHFRLVVEDNGVGLPAGLVPARVASLGLRLVAGLAQQMQATLHLGAAPGACFTLIFQELPVSASSARA